MSQAIVMEPIGEQMEAVSQPCSIDNTRLVRECVILIRDQGPVEILSFERDGRIILRGVEIGCDKEAADILHDCVTNGTLKV